MEIRIKALREVLDKSEIKKSTDRLGDIVYSTTLDVLKDFERKYSVNFYEVWDSIGTEVQINLLLEYMNK